MLLVILMALASIPWKGETTSMIYYYTQYKHSIICSNNESFTTFVFQIKVCHTSSPRISKEITILSPKRKMPITGRVSWLLIPKEIGIESFPFTMERNNDSHNLGILKRGEITIYCCILKLVYWKNAEYVIYSVIHEY